MHPATLPVSRTHLSHTPSCCLMHPCAPGTHLSPSLSCTVSPTGPRPCAVVLLHSLALQTLCPQLTLQSNNFPSLLLLVQPLSKAIFAIHSPFVYLDSSDPSLHSLVCSCSMFNPSPCLFRFVREFLSFLPYQFRLYYMNILP